MKISNNLKLKGRVHFDVKDVKTGKILQKFDDHNLIVNGALLATVKLLGNTQSPSPITKIGFGTSATQPDYTDASLANPYVKNLSDVHIESNNTSVTFDFVLGTDEDNGVTINELGLMCTDGTLFARRVLPSPVVKNVNVALEGTWTITIAQGE